MNKKNQLLCSSKNIASGIETGLISSPIDTFNEIVAFCGMSSLVHKISNDIGCVESLKLTPRVNSLVSLGINVGIGANSWIVTLLLCFCS